MLPNLMAEKLIINYEHYKLAVEKLAIEIEKNYKPTVLVGIMRGAAPIIDMLSRIFKLPTAYVVIQSYSCLLYTSPSPRDSNLSRMPSSA